MPRAHRRVTRHTPPRNVVTFGNAFTLCVTVTPSLGGGDAVTHVVEVPRSLVAVVRQPRLTQNDERDPVMAQLEHLIGKSTTASSQDFDVTRILPSRSAFATNETSSALNSRSVRFDMRFPTKHMKSPRKDWPGNYVAGRSGHFPMKTAKLPLGRCTVTLRPLMTSTITTGRPFGSPLG